MFSATFNKRRTNIPLKEDKLLRRMKTNELVLTLLIAIGCGGWYWWKEREEHNFLVSFLLVRTVWVDK